MPVQGLPYALDKVLEFFVDTFDLSGWQVYQEKEGACLKLRFKTRPDGLNTGLPQARSFKKKSSTQQLRDRKRAQAFSKNNNMDKRITRSVAKNKNMDLEMMRSDIVDNSQTMSLSVSSIEADISSIGHSSPKQQHSESPKCEVGQVHCELDLGQCELGSSEDKCVFVVDSKDTDCHDHEGINLSEDNCNEEDDNMKTTPLELETDMSSGDDVDTITSLHEVYDMLLDLKNQFDIQKNEFEIQMNTICSEIKNPPVDTG